MKFLFLLLLLSLSSILLLNFAYAEKELSELENLKKFIPDDFDYDEQGSNNLNKAYMNKATTVSAYRLVDKVEGVVDLITISQFKNENQMWDTFKEYHDGAVNLKDITILSTKCFEDNNEFGPSIICGKDHFLIVVGTLKLSGSIPYKIDAKEIMKSILNKMNEGIFLSKGGGCLIATATYGSELTPQVQQLRELRDNSLLQTASGTSFMAGFNQFYYSFSPTIADWERENPAFKEFVKITLTPMISSLSILNYVNMDSEESVLGYGISLITLNIGMYFVAPTLVIVGIKRKLV
jgi:hypothetical protein